MHPWQNHWLCPWWTNYLCGLECIVFSFYLVKVLFGHDFHFFFTHFQRKFTIKIVCNKMILSKLLSQPVQLLEIQVELILKNNYKMHLIVCFFVRINAKNLLLYIQNSFLLSNKNNTFDIRRYIFLQFKTENMIVENLERRKMREKKSIRVRFFFIFLTPNIINSQSQNRI